MSAEPILWFRKVGDGIDANQVQYTARVMDTLYLIEKDRKGWVLWVLNRDQDGQVWDTYKTLADAKGEVVKLETRQSRYPNG